MMTHKKIKHILLLAALCGGAVLSACGGGGDSTATPLSVVEPPVDSYPADATEEGAPPVVETPSGGYPGAGDGAESGGPTPEGGYPAP